MPDYKFEDIAEDAEFSRRYAVGEEVYHALTEVFGDRSPVHVDEDYARRAGFAGRVMHGAILQGFLSHFVGMHFPGRRSLILSVNIGYRNPTYLGDEVLLTARVQQKVETGRVVVLQVRLTNAATHAVLASGRVQVAIREDG